METLVPGKWADHRYTSYKPKNCFRWKWPQWVPAKALNQSATDSRAGRAGQQSTRSASQLKNQPANHPPNWLTTHPTKDWWADLHPTGRACGQPCLLRSHAATSWPRSQPGAGMLSSRAGRQNGIADTEPVYSFLQMVFNFHMYFLKAGHEISSFPLFLSNHKNEC